MLYACGSNGCGQLGLHHTEDVDQWTPVNIDLRGAVDICGGGNHTVIVEKDTGRALISQNAKFCAIGHPYQRKWRLASAGWDFMYLVDEENQLWHSDLQGQVEARPYSFPASVQAISSGMKHTAVLLENSQVFAWGNSRRGQCGFISLEIETPVELAATAGMPISIACGRDYTAILGLRGDESRLAIYGDQRKFPDLATKVFPALIATTVRSGWSHILVNGEVFGNNFCQQRDLPNSNFSAATLGSEHGLLVVGQVVYTWGWGEHGNCPPPREFAGLIDVFGGCATSFVYVQ